MKIIVDSQKQLNYHPLVIYFILQPNDFKKYSRNIELLNEDRDFTRRIFKFRAVARGNEYSRDLKNGLTATINKFNVILRLIDDGAGNYNYALGRINLNQSSSQFELSLQNFIVDACKYNIKNLKAQLGCYGGKSEESIENATMISAMVQSFKDAINFKTFKRKGCGIADPMLVAKSDRTEHLFSRSNILTSSLPSDFSRQLPTDIAGLRNSLYRALPNRKAKDDFKKMMAFFEANMDIPSIEESDMYVQGTVDDSKSGELIADYKSRNKQSERPNIIISISKIIKKWGVEVNIDGNIKQISFSSNAATMVYICTLLKQKMGTHLWREVFKRPLPDRNSSVKRHEDVIWLGRVYRVICSRANEEFDIWYPKMRNNSCHFINQGKSQSIRDIKKKIASYPNAIYYCSIQIDKDDKDQSYYWIDIPAECIKIPQELESLI